MDPHSNTYFEYKSTAGFHIDNKEELPRPIRYKTLAGHTPAINNNPSNCTLIFHQATYIKKLICRDHENFRNVRT